MATYQLSILTPKGLVYEDSVESLVAPGANGSFGVLAHHAPMISATTPGVLKVNDGQDRFFAVGSGMVEVCQNKVNILADHAETSANFEEARSKASEFPVSSVLDVSPFRLGSKFFHCLGVRICLLVSE